MRILEEFWYGNVEPTEYDINAELSKNPKLWGLIRQLIAVDPSEEQITQIEQLIYAGISASGGTTNDIE